MRGMRQVDPLHLLQTGVLTLFETTLIYLVGTILTGIGDSSTLRWWILLVVVAISTVVAARLEPINADVSHISPLTAIIAAVVVAWSVTWHIRAVGGGLALFSTLINPDGEHFTAAYTALIASVVAWLRGIKLLDIGHSEMVQHFRRGIIAVAIALGVGIIAGFGQGLTPRISATSANIPAWMIVLLLLGLLSLSITRISTVEGDGGRSARWMWLRSSALSSLTILLVGLVALSLFASPARQVLRLIVGTVVYAFAIVLAPFVWLAYTLLEFLRSTFMRDVELPRIPLPMATAQPDQLDPINALPVPNGLMTASTLLVLLVPVVIVIVLIFFATRRRAPLTATENEERESIFSWSGFGTDISNLLAGLRRPQADESGLRKVLTLLVAEDPVTRIRRRYVELLLQGEAAEKRRRDEETPREFAQTLAGIAKHRTSLDVLTATYEQARYAPESVDQATADRADRAWQELRTDDQKSG